MYVLSHTGRFCGDRELDYIVYIVFVSLGSFWLGLELLLPPLGLPWDTFWRRVEGLGPLWLALGSPGPPPWVFP